METPLFFSIIIPTYNRAKLILKTLDTVFKQSFTNFEVLVIDNCSTDNTLEVLKPYIETGRIRFIQHDRNYERSKSRNTGIKNAKGKYLTFLDSDDYMYPDNLKDAYEFAIKNPDTKLFHNLYEKVTPEGKLLNRYTFPSLEDPRAKIVEGNFISCIGVFMHEDLYRVSFFEEDSRATGSEDYIYWIQVLARYNKVGRIHKVNSGIVEHENRSVNNFDFGVLIKRINYILDKVENDKELRSVYVMHLPRLKSSLALYISSMASIYGKPLIAFKYLALAVKEDFSILFIWKFWHHFLLPFYKLKNALKA